MRKQTLHEFIIRAKEKHGDKYDYSIVDYIDMHTYVNIICKLHGIFKQTPSCHLRGSGCRQCGILIRASKKRKGLNNFIIQAKEIHGDKYDYSNVEYINIDTKIQIICNLHGKFEQTPESHLRGRGCPSCGKITSILKKTKTSHQFIQDSKKIHGNLYDYSNVIYVNSKTRVDIICKYHGIFKQKPCDHLQGKGCISCNKKKNENCMFEYITQYFKDYKFEKIRPVWLKNTTGWNLELDCYCEQLKLAFEYNGMQHYHYTKFFHNNDINKFYYQQEKDKLKKKLCEENSVYLIIIPYQYNIYNIKKMYGYIDEKIKEWEISRK